MAKTIINLLPPEILARDKHQSTIRLFIWISGVFLVIIVTAAAALLLTKLFFSRQIEAREKIIDQQTVKIQSLQIQEGLLFNVRKRLTQIDQISEVEAKPLNTYDLSLGTVPPGFKLLYFTLDKSGSAIISLESSSSANLKRLFDNLANPTTAEGNIIGINMDSLSRGATDTYKIDLKIDYK